MLADQMWPVALVVEDDWLLRDDIAMELKSEGWHVVEAVNGEAALDLFDTTIDVLFTDIQLGGCLNGWDVAEALRAQNPELAVIYSSGKSADRARQVSRGLFFAKPYSLAEIVDACWLLTDSAKRPSVSLS